MSTASHLRLVLVGLLSALVIALGSSPAHADEPPTLGFGISPVDAAGTPGLRALFSFGLPPGATANDRVAVLNYARTPVVFDLYAVDAVNTDDGAVAFADTTETSRDLGTWITLDTPAKQVTVPGRDAQGQPGKLIVPVTIKVPLNAAPGDHGAGILASVSTLGRNEQSQNIRLEQRVAARVYVRVAGDAKPGLAITTLDARYDAAPLPWQPGRLVVDYEIVNSGNVRMGVTPSFEVSGPFGLGGRRVDQPVVPELLPHQAQAKQIVIDDVWPTLMTTVTLTATPRAAVAAAEPGIAAVSRSVVVLTIAIWMLLLLGAVLLGGIMRRRRRDRSTRRPAPGSGTRAAAKERGRVLAGSAER